MDHETAYTHLKNGAPVKSRIEHYPCPAERTIFVPVDRRLRIAVVIPNHMRPHNHPMPPMIKASFDAKAAYRKCVTQTGIPAATAKRVDACMFSPSHCRWAVVSSLFK